MREFDGDTCNRLAARIASLELEADEQSLLDLILERAADGDEVIGHELKPTGQESLSRQEQASKLTAPDLTLGGVRLAVAAGFRF